MQEVRLLIVLIMLAICTVDDIGRKEVNVVVVGVLGVLAVIVGSISYVLDYDTWGDIWNGARQDIITHVIFGAAPGVVLYLLSKLRSGIGEADGIIFIILGLNFGLSVAFEMMFISLVAACVFGLFTTAVKKVNKSFTFAFVPFILISFWVYFMKQKYRSGSLTIELALIMPGIMAVIFLIIFMGYYMHDKCVIKRAMYVSVLRETEVDEVFDEGDIFERFEQLTDGHLLGVWQLSKNVTDDDGKLLMSVNGTMSSPIGFVNRYIQNKAFSINMDAYSYIKPDF